jgi:hypothetical protein
LSFSNLLISLRSILSNTCIYIKDNCTSFFIAFNRRSMTVVVQTCRVIGCLKYILLCLYWNDYFMINYLKNNCFDKRVIYIFKIRNLFSSNISTCNISIFISLSIENSGVGHSTCFIFTHIARRFKADANIIYIYIYIALSNYLNRIMHFNPFLTSFMRFTFWPDYPHCH